MDHKRESMIQYDSISKNFGETRAVDNIDLSVERGEFMALIGPSGSGKTTTLRMLAGFETPTKGDIYLAGTSVKDIPPHKRDTTTVFQNYALFPHMTVSDNLAFGLRQRGYDKNDINDRVDEVLSLVDMVGFENREPNTLSGGQQQRVATARALAPEPKVLLMDEPLGALDKKLRDQIRVDFARLQDELKITTLYVTHNQEEALTMADKIAVMNNGRIEQIGSPTTVYEDPKTQFVSNFIGNATTLSGNFSEREGKPVLQMNGSEIHLNTTDSITDDSTVFVRPENIEITKSSANMTYDNVLSGILQQTLFTGDKFQYYVEVNNQEFIVDGSAKNKSLGDGDEVTLGWDSEDTRVVRE